ncbi:MAG: glycosyltransferase family 39 protein, partial [Flavobacteriales bacterium]
LHGVLFEKRGLSYDESISYLCSAANQGRYNAEFAPIRDKEMTAADVQALYATPKLDFHKVATDMSTLDRHPPLYFWALHAVHHFFGFHLNDGMVLNFLVGLFTALLLFLLVRQTSGSGDLALLVVVLFSLSPAVAQLDLEARNYQFLGLFALASAWLSERIGSGHNRSGTYVLFIAVNICGFLTHYYYAFILVPGIILQWRRHGLGREWLVYIASLALSLLGFLAIFPQIFNFVSVYLRETPGIHHTVLDKIWLLTYFGWAGFFANGPRVLYAVAFAVLVVAAGMGLSRKLLRGRIAELLRGKGALSYFLWTMVWNIAFTTAFYFMEIAPNQAVGEQYFAYFWPLFAWFVVLGLRAGLPARVRPWAIGLLLITMLVSLRFSVRNSDYLTNLLPDTWYQRMNAADRLVTNELKRSHLPRLSLGLRPNLPLHLTRDLEASTADENAKEVCILVDGPNPLKRPVVQELMAQPGVKTKVLTQEYLTLICITKP